MHNSPKFRKTILAHAVTLGLTSFAVVPSSALGAVFLSCPEAAAGLITVSDARYDCWYGTFGNPSLFITNTGSLSATPDSVHVYTVVGLTNSGSVAGNISITGTMSGGIINNAGGVINGRILLDPAGFSTAARIEGSINNAGFLGQGIRNGGTIVGGVTNTGTISGGITNLGMISGGITNSGLISGGITAQGTVIGSLGAGITNTGTIFGSLLLGDNILNLNGNGMVTGNIQATGSTGVVNVNGTYTRSTPGSSLSATAFNINEGGTLNFSAAGTINSSNAMVNGTLGAAAGVQIGTGNMTINGTFRTGVDSASNYGKLLAEGRLALPSVAKIDVDVASVNTLALGDRLVSVMAAGSITGADSFSITDNSALFRFTGVKLNNGSIDLLVENERTIRQSVFDLGNNPALNAGGVLDTLMQLLPPGFAPVSTAFGLLPTAAQVNAAATQTLPLLLGNNQVAMQSSTNGTNRIIQARQENQRGVSSGEAFAGDRRMWFKAYGGRADQNNLRGIAGYNANTQGGVFGVDAELSRTDRVGLALAYGTAGVSSKSDVAPSRSKVKTYQLVGYGSHSLSETTEAHYQVDVGNHRTKGQRDILFMGLTALADYSSTSYHLGGGVSHSMRLNAQTSISPYLQADYTNVRDNSYTETNAGVLNLNVSAHTTQQLILMGGSKFQYQVNDNASIVGNLGLGWDTMAKQGSLTSSYAGGGAAFTTPGLDPKPWVVQAGIGFVTQLKSGLDLSLRYDYEGRESFKNQTASAKLRWMF